MCQNIYWKCQTTLKKHICSEWACPHRQSLAGQKIVLSHTGSAGSHKCHCLLLCFKMYTISATIVYINYIAWSCCDGCLSPYQHKSLSCKTVVLCNRVGHHLLCSRKRKCRAIEADENKALSDSGWQWLNAIGLWSATTLQHICSITCIIYIIYYNPE